MQLRRDWLSTEARRLLNLTRSRVTGVLLRSTGDEDAVPYECRCEPEHPVEDRTLFEYDPARPCALLRNVSGVELTSRRTVYAMNKEEQTYVVAREYTEETPVDLSNCLAVLFRHITRLCIQTHW
ncbi:MAG: hypothetical protein MHM6MM_006334 [Cercozoa sp. M6MM]